MSTINYREADERDDETTANFCVAQWTGMGFAEEELLPNATDRTLRFVKEARRDLQFTSFIAEVGGVPVGSACCQLFAGLYPLIFKEKRRFGYVWGVFVNPEHRKKGIASQLIQNCIEHLKAIQCTQISLHAAPQAKPMYGALGFVEGRELRLDLAPFYPQMKS